MNNRERERERGGERADKGGVHEETLQKSKGIKADRRPQGIQERERKRVQERERERER